MFRIQMNSQSQISIKVSRFKNEYNNLGHSDYSYFKKYLLFTLVLVLTGDFIIRALRLLNDCF